MCQSNHWIFKFACQTCRDHAVHMRHAETSFLMESCIKTTPNCPSHAFQLANTNGKPHIPPPTPQQLPFHQPTQHHSTTPPLQFKTMPLRLWPKRSKRKSLETRLRRLEKDKNRFATTLDVCNFWNEMASGYGLTRRIQALETWQENTDIALLRLMRDVTVAERKLNMILPLDEDEDDGTTERASTARTSSLDVSSENNIGPTLLPGGTPVTFTRRKSNSAERVTLDGSGLRLPGPARSAEAHKSRSVG
jgi:hypothetical protein